MRENDSGPRVVVIDGLSPREAREVLFRWVRGEAFFADGLTEKFVREIAGLEEKKDC